MASIAIQTAQSDKTIVITPLYEGDKFPLFDEVEITEDGFVRGWCGMNQPSGMHLQELGRYYSEQRGCVYVKLERFDELQVVLKIIN